MITMIVSGGQTGADRAALDAAKSLNFPTGGWAPKNYRTDEGSDWSLKDYGLRQAFSTDYPQRTILNVRESDGTVIFGRSSPGINLTEYHCCQHHRPFLRLPFPTEIPISDHVNDIIQFVNTHRVQVLNVAGNRRRTNPGIYDHVLEIMKLVLREANRGRRSPAAACSRYEMALAFWEALNVGIPGPYLPFNKLPRMQRDMLATSAEHFLTAIAMYEQTQTRKQAMKYTIMCIDAGNCEIELAPRTFVYTTYRETFSAALQALEKGYGIPEDTHRIQMESHRRPPNAQR